jgi:hypothetical protein
VADASSDERVFSFYPHDAAERMAITVPREGGCFASESVSSGAVVLGSGVVKDAGRKLEAG